MILSLLLIYMDHRGDYLASVRTQLTRVVTPVQYVVSWPMNVVAWLEQSFTSRQSLLEQNADLKAKLLLLKAKLYKTVMLQQENAQLRALLQSQPRQNDRVLVAELLAVDPDAFVQQVVLNKGSKQGVYLGQPVLDANGVFGQVVEVGSSSSRVMLITDTRSAVPVQDSQSGVRGIIVGRGDIKLLKLTNMPNTADIKIGDTLVTSGLGERYPAGYPVGTIISIEHNSSQHFATILVKPSAHLYRSHLVLLAWPSFQIATQSQESVNNTKNTKKLKNDHRIPKSDKVTSSTHIGVENVH